MYNTRALKGERYKILFVNLFSEIGGAETSLLYLLKALDRTKFEPIVIVPKKGYFSDRLEDIGIKIIYLHLPGFFIRELFIPGMSLKGIWNFYKLCKRIKPDLIHLTNITQAFYAGIAGKLLKIPVVAISWMDSDSIYFYQDLIINFSVDKIIAVSPELKDRILRRNILTKEKVSVITPGVDTKKFLPTHDKEDAKRKLRIPKQNVVITIAARFDPIKGHMTFLQAMRLVTQRVPNISILIAQDPKINLEDANIFAPQVKKDIDLFLKNNKDLADKVIFTGYQKNMVPIYRTTDILVSTSLYESLGMILMEAASSGLPIVSTNKNGQYLIVKDRKTGFLVPIKSPRIMTERILLLAQNQTLRNKFGKAARKHAVTYFSIERYVNQVEKIYLSLIKKFTSAF